MGSTILHPHELRPFSSGFPNHEFFLHITIISQWCLHNTILPVSRLFLSNLHYFQTGWHVPNFIEDVPFQRCLKDACKAGPCFFFIILHATNHFTYLNITCAYPRYSLKAHVDDYFYLASLINDLFRGMLVAVLRWWQLMSILPPPPENRSSRELILFTS